MLAYARIANSNSVIIECASVVLLWMEFPRVFTVQNVSDIADKELKSGSNPFHKAKIKKSRDFRMQSVFHKKKILRKFQYSIQLNFLCSSLLVSLLAMEAF